MCGIAGYIRKHGDIDRSVFDHMVDMISYRGPDDRGVYIKNGVALGHRRLSIIDISSDGHQPFMYMNRFVAVYNGEIYNYIELRKELEEKGYQFNTRTDTEVLLAAYAEWNRECVNRFNGMWAFAVYDLKEKIIFSSRDRYGVKPFYFYKGEDTFLFGSEIKQILYALGNRPRVNKRKLIRFIYSGDVDDDNETMFDGVFQLLPGNNLILNLRDFTLDSKEYYSIEDVINSEYAGDYEKACREFKELYYDAIRLRLRSDVSVGYCLSGGLDSSSNVCVAHEIDSDSVQECVTSCSEYKEYDEQEYADAVAEKTGCRMNKLYPNGENLFDELDDLIWHMDEPFGTTSIYASRCVFKKSREVGLTVMLDGQGADELLAGYSYWYQTLFVWLLQHGKIGAYRRELKEYFNKRKDTEKHVPYRHIAYAAIIKAYAPKGKSILQRIKVGKSEFAGFFPKDNRKYILLKQNDVKKFGMSYDKQYGIESMVGLRDLLHFEDRNTMTYSIESRLPFLDYRLVDIICRMPITYKIRSGMTKAVMRDALKGVLPEKVRQRISKLGFVTAEDKWISSNLEKYDREIKKSCERLDGIIIKDRVIEWWNGLGGVIPRNESMPWRLICAAHWADVFNVDLTL